MGCHTSLIPPSGQRKGQLSRKDWQVVGMDPSESSVSSPRVVIVGAGIAGLSAAEHLVKNGVTDVVILEAQGRVGGRILTRDDFGELFNWH